MQKKRSEGVNELRWAERSQVLQERPPPASCDCSCFYASEPRCRSCAARCNNDNNDIWWIQFAGLSRPKESSKFWGRHCAESLFMRHTDLWANVISNAEIWIKAQWGGFLDPKQSPVISFHYIWRLISLPRKAASLSRLEVFPWVFIKKAAGMWRRKSKIWVA